MQGVSRAERAYADLRAAIEQGRYPEGLALPTQPSLARTLGVSTVTLRQALERLAEEGFVEARHGSGTFVRSQQAARGPILVADDDPATRSLMVDALQMLGYRVEAVESGEAAVECVRHHSFTHVLLDVRMGELTGLEAAEQIARIAPRTVVIFVTGYPLDLFRREQRTYRAPTLVVQKPFDLSELEQALQLKVH
jgi:CheY-like chemotaxis protein